MPTGRKGKTTMKKTIIMQNEAIIRAEGTKNSNHCKPTMMWSVNGDPDIRFFTSIEDAAKEIKTNQSYLSRCITNKKACKGYRVCPLSQANEYLGEMAISINSKASKDSEDARKWREYQAEQEALRIAEEKRQAEIRKAEGQRQEKIAKLRERVAKCEEKCNEYTAKLNEAMNMKDEVERELESLLGENEEVA